MIFLENKKVIEEIKNESISLNQLTKEIISYDEFKELAKVGKTLIIRMINVLNINFSKHIKQ